MNQDVPQRWRLEQANWTQYQDTLSTFQLPDGSIDDTVKAFSDAILLATEKTVPQTGRTRRNKNVPWWNEEVARVISEKKHAFNVFRRSPTQENMIEFKRLRAKARNVIINSKRQSWKITCHLLPLKLLQQKYGKKLDASEEENLHHRPQLYLSITSKLQIKWRLLNFLPIISNKLAHQTTIRLLSLKPNVSLKYP
ncbi:hypothetical protein JTB14_033780 [Gonioctena quinquepunctata]|nr:hypothetical protein JTB14_033780 [Gonioctena quinquepunctata]